MSTTPRPRAYPTAAARRKPRASTPASASTEGSRVPASASVTALNAPASAKSGLRSRNSTPGSGKSGTSAIRPRASSSSTSALPLPGRALLLDAGGDAGRGRVRLLLAQFLREGVVVRGVEVLARGRPALLGDATLADPLGLLRVLRVAHLEVDQQRRRQRDRRQDADEGTGELHQRQVLQRARAEQHVADDQQAENRQQGDERRVERPHQGLV